MFTNPIMYKKISYIAYAFLLASPLVASAAPWTLANPSPGAGTTLREFIYLLLNILQVVAIPLLVMCIIYGGFLLVTAGGDETQITKAKQWVLWSLVGGAIIVGAEVIADIVYGTAILFN